LADWFEEYNKYIEQMRTLEDGWDSYDAPAPNQLALEGAKKIGNLMKKLGFEPARLAPLADGGTEVFFYKKNRFGLLDTYNEGEICACTGYVKSTDPLNIWEVTDLEDALQKIWAHVHPTREQLLIELTRLGDE
jgi:hypothetical protein